MVIGPIIVHLSPKFPTAKAKRTYFFYFLEVHCTLLCSRMCRDSKKKFHLLLMVNKKLKTFESQKLIE